MKVEREFNIVEMGTTSKEIIEKAKKTSKYEMLKVVKRIESCIHCCSWTTTVIKKQDEFVYDNYFPIECCVCNDYVLCCAFHNNEATRRFEKLAEPWEREMTFRGSWVGFDEYIITSAASKFKKSLHDVTCIQRNPKYNKKRALDINDFHLVLLDEEEFAQCVKKRPIQVIPMQPDSKTQFNYKEEELIAVYRAKMEDIDKKLATVFLLVADPR